MAHSFVVRRLTGEYVLDHPSASMCEPLYDTGANDWIRDWAEEVASGLALPRLLWPGEAAGEAAGEVTPDSAGATGIPVGTPVAAGTTDAWSEAVSVGIRDPGDLMLMYATTMVVWQMLAESLRAPNPVEHRGLLSRHARAGGRHVDLGRADRLGQRPRRDVDYATLVDEPDASSRARTGSSCSPTSPANARPSATPGRVASWPGSR